MRVGRREHGDGTVLDELVVRLSPDRLAAVVASGEGRGFEVMPGRPMKGYVALSDGDVADDARIEAWVAEALAYTATMPPKR